MRPSRNAKSAPTDPPASTEDARYHHGDLRRALVSAALALLNETQDWGFSLREVARRAGVSHNAPYNHFAGKQALLAAVAAAGYDTLRDHMQMAAVQKATPAAALQAVGVAYVRFGVANPAHYRLMFGTALGTVKDGASSVLGESSVGAKGLLVDIVRRGAEQGHFAISPTDPRALDMAVLSAWSLVHGLTVLLIDGLAGTEPTPDPATAAGRIAEHVTQILLDGISTEQSRHT